MAVPVIPPEIRAITFEVADRLAPELRQRFLAVVGVAAQFVPLDELESLLRRGAFSTIMSRFEEGLAFALASPEFTNYVDANAALFAESFKLAGRGVAVNVGLSLASTTVRTLLEENAGRQILAVTADSLTSIRATLSSAYLEGIGSRAGARLIRSSIGLLPRHSATVVRYAESLRTQGHPETVVTRLAEQYAQRLLNYRADVIARTESIYAAMAAQTVKWEEWAAAGVLESDRTWVEWMVTPDDRLCPYCAPMDGVRIRIGGRFESTEIDDSVPYKPGRTLAPTVSDPRRDARGRFAKRLRSSPLSVKHPPLHPQCRCTLVLRFEE